MNRFVLLLASAPFALASLALVPACSSSTASTPSGSSGTADAGTTPDEDSGLPAGGTECTAARKTYLGPIAKVTEGAVKVISSADGVSTIYIDASAGGTPEAAQNPRVYIKLTGDRVDVNDNDAFTSTDWDLAFKRVDIYTNSGDAGAGKGGAAKVSKSFDSVTAADADAAEIAAEKFFDENCVGKKDEANFIVTTFAGWYDYQVGGSVSAKASTTFVVRGADGTSRYKVGIVSYTAKDDGTTTGTATGRYLIKVAAL